MDNRFRSLALSALMASSLLLGNFVPVKAQATDTGYHAAWINQNSNPTLSAGQAYQFEVHLQNTGFQTWRRGVVNLGTDRAMDRTPLFIREDRVNHQASGWLSPNRVSLVETTVAPGAIGTFRFFYTVPNTLPDGLYREYFRPVADGVTWMEDMGIYWDVTVANGQYQASFVAQNAHPTLSTGQSYSFELQLRNTGSATWRRGVVNLGTDRPMDRLPVFSQPNGWLKANRVVLVESSVAPGAIGTFRFSYSVPTGLAAGTYREYFRPVADGVSWMNDLGIFWDVTVASPGTSATTSGSGAAASSSAAAGGASASASASAGGSAAAASSSASSF